jgi:thymidine kinase
MVFIKLFIGPMFSGKTSALLDIYNNNHTTKKILTINYIQDTRYSNNMLSTHDKNMIPCIQLEKLHDIKNKKYERKLEESEIILINEAQFFPDLYDFCLSLENTDKDIYICGLDSDFKRNKFGEILDIIPFCHEVVKLRANCSKCKGKNNALFTYRLSEEKEQLVIGSSNYIPLCRECYIK